MPINRDLSVSPYHDDFSEEKNFYKVLFKPGTAVQVRELNQLQTILQAQIEKFGNNIYKRGTIIDGVNFIYHTNYAYAKIKDSQLDGIPAAPSLYVGNFAVDPVSNLTAYIINSEDGFESTAPNLKTIYLRYINSGNTGLETSFSPGSNLKVYDYLDSINTVVINNGSTGFANSDSVVFCSAIAVNVTSNAQFTVGETVTQSGNTKFAIIDSIETVNNKKILRIRPRQADLTNTAVSTSTWQFTPGASIIGSVSTAAANILESIGTGCSATIITSADVGKITDVNITARGSGYYVSPYATIKSSGVPNALGDRNYTDLSLTARNYLAQLVVSESANSIGSGYAFSVTEGVIYQKGFFLKVKPQTIIVDKYSNAPDSVSVGFDSIESIVDSNSDQSLLDNATGQRNEFAPGADRLSVEPQLIVLGSEEAAANNEFFSIVDFSEGNPYRENKKTQFNSVLEELAVRTNEQSGNFVIDKFLVATRSTANQTNEGKMFSIVTDPGRGYIDGYRVETKTNFVKNTDKGVDFRSALNLSASIDYGNYLLVDQFAGALNFNAGGVVALYDTARLYPSNTTLVNTGTISATGNQIGSARVRNVVYDSGDVGTPSARYRVYLFNITMNASKSIAEVRSIFYNGTLKSIADVVLNYDATSNTSIAVLNDVSDNTSLLIDTGTQSTKDLNNIDYVYRTTNETVEIAPAGTLSALLSASEEFFAYSSATLTDNEKNEVVLVATGNNVVMQINASANGTANCQTSSNVVALSIANTVNKYDVGDYVALYSAPGNYVMRRVTGKQTGALQIDSAPGFTVGAANLSRAFPKGLPIALSGLSGAAVTLTGGNKTLNINLGAPIESANNIAAAITYNVSVSNTAPQAKTADRDNMVKINLANNVGQLAGPWTLGIPDVFRLKNVYLSNSNTVNVNSTDVTDQFFIDHNQSEDFYGLSYLYKRSDANISLNANTFLLVKFDAFTSSAGVYTINSYVSANTTQRYADDSLTLSGLGTKTNSFEIPEVYTASGRTIDLINCIDFRPMVANTAVYSKTSAGATINPSETQTFSGSNKKFPLPETAVSFDRSYFLGRKDVVVVNTSNKINVVRGVPSDTLPYPDPKVPSNTIVLSKINIPSYPCVPEKFSANTFEILNRKMSNERLLLKRIRDKTIKSETNSNDVALNQPKAFTMQDIGQLERRIKDLEYTVSLSLVESDLKDKIIPSSINPAINRFKYGFFVDDYTTKKNSDIDNVEYQADVVDSRVVPIAESTLVTHGRGFNLKDWTSELTLINQDQASEPPVPPVVPLPEELPPPSPVTPTPTPGDPPGPVTVPTPTPPTPVVVPTPPTVSPIIGPGDPILNVVAKEVSAFRSYRNSTLRRYDEFPVTMSTINSNFSIRYNFYGARDRLFVVKILPDGAEELMYNVNLNGRGTLNFNNDPARGNKYVIRVVAGSSKWEYWINYSIDSTYYTYPKPPALSLNTVFYTGTVASIYPGTILAHTLEQNFGELLYSSQGFEQTVSLAGLKPNTVHNISISDYTTAIVASPILGGDNIVGPGSVVTNEGGLVNFNMQIDTQVLASIESLNAQNNAARGTNVPNVVLVTVASADNSSIAAFYITARLEENPINWSPTIIAGLSGGSGGIAALDGFMNLTLINVV